MSSKIVDSEGTYVRAETPEQKRWIIERLYIAWCQQPEHRLGQLISNAIRGPIEADTLFYIEDVHFIRAIERFCDRVKGIENS